MTDNYKATPEQWNNIEGSAYGRNPLSNAACLLELRARVEALEAQASNYPAIPDSSTPPPVATDEELDDTWHKTTGGTFLGRRRAIYNLGVAHGQASSREVAEPARMVQLPTPSQIAECGGPCFESGREACDCGLRNDPAPVAGVLARRIGFDTIRRALEALPNDHYSYLAKDEMAMSIALDVVNKLSRKHHVSTRKRTKV
jgi:hypothetical protein